jgi:hypothetical protein
LDLERSEHEIDSLENQSLQAAGGNSRAARRLRVKSQLRDKKGRWVEMGRRASIDVKINGKKTKVQGRFVGSDPKAPGVRGLFLVEADEARGIKRGVYSFKGRAVNQVLASLDPEYLEDQGIKDPNRDVNGNLNGFTLDEDIEELNEVYFEEVGELDEALATGKLSTDEVSQAFNERARAGAHESYNVVATLEEADTEVLTEEQLDEILEDVGATPDETIRPEPPKEEAPRKATPEELKPTTPEVEPVSKDIRDGVRPVDADSFDASKATDDELKAILKREDWGDQNYSKASQEWAKRYGPRDFPGAPDFRTPVGTTRPGIRQYGGSWDPNDYVMGPNGYWVPQGGNDRSNRRSEGPATVPLEQPARPKTPTQPADKPAATFKTADRLVPGDVVKMPDGTTRKVIRNSTVDSGSLVSFEPREGERRGTYKTYRDDDLVEIEQEPVARIEEPAPQVEEPVEQPTEEVEAPAKTQALLDIEETLGREMTYTERVAIGPSTIGKDALIDMTRETQPTGEELLDAGIRISNELYEADKEKHSETIALMDVKYGISRSSDRTTANQEGFNPDRVVEVLGKVRDFIKRDRTLSEVFDDADEILNPATEDPELRSARDMVYYMSDLIERSGADLDTKESYYNALTLGLNRDLLNKVASRPEIPAATSGKADTVKKITARRTRSGEGGITVDPITMKQSRAGISVAVEGTNEEVSDVLFYGPLGDLIVADFIDRNKDKIRQGFKLGTWHDKENNEVTFDLVEVFPEGRLEQAKIAGKERNQQGIFNLKNKDYIPTGGTGDRGRARRARERARGEVRIRPELGRELGPNDASGEGGASAPDSGANAGELERLVFRPLDGEGFVPIFDLADISFEPAKIDLSKLSLKQRSVVKRLVANRQALFDLAVKAAKKKDGKLYQKAYSLVAAATDVAKRFIKTAGGNRDFSFGSGDEERLKNMVFFKDSLTVDEATNEIKTLQGIYTAKNGKSYYLKYGQDGGYKRAGVYPINPDGTVGANPLAYVNVNWSGENFRGDSEDRNVSISYLGSNSEKGGFAGAAVTLARYVVEGSGREFAHSSNLTPEGSNNSKAIEPTNPRRHHYSQSEKVLSLMNAPVIQTMRNMGWFKSDSPLRGFASRIAKFEKPLDVGKSPKNNRENMLGPAYMIDRQMISLMSFIDGAAYSEAFVTYRDNGRKSQDLSIQFMLEDLNWKDGISKEDAVKRLRSFEKALNNVNDYLVTQNRAVNPKYEAQAKIYGTLADALEADVDFDSKRLDRPKKLDRTIPRQIQLLEKEGEFYTVASDAVELAGISADYRLHNFASLADNRMNAGMRAYLEQWSYERAFPGETRPALWTNSAEAIARKFSSEQLFEALQDGIQRAVTNSEPDKVIGAELDFRREFAETEDKGFVPLATVANALRIQGATKDGVGLEEFIAEAVDKANGFDLNIKRIDQSKVNDAKVLAQMEEFLSTKVPSGNNESDVAEELNVIEGEPEAPQQYYDEQSGQAVSLNPTTTTRTDAPLISNEFFDLPNDFGQILVAARENFGYDAEYTAMRRNASLDFKVIAQRFRSEDLQLAFINSIDNGNDYVPLRFAPSNEFPDGYVQQTPIALVRDSLQVQGIDTNGLIRQRARALNQPENSAEEVLNAARDGRVAPQSVASILNELKEPVIMNSWIRVSGTEQGTNSPQIFEDLDTGKKWLVKSFTASQAQNAEDEIFTQAFYRLAGIRASTPRRGRRVGSSNEIYVVSEYLPADENKTYPGILRSRLTPDEIENADRVREAVLNGLPVDILVDNIDGPFNSGNVLMGPNGEVTRIDGGGGLTTDPGAHHGSKTETRRYRAMWTQGKEADAEDLRVKDIALNGGSFDGDGIDFSFNLFLSTNGYHWNKDGGQRGKVLGPNFSEDQLTDRVAETLSLITPNAIRELMSGMKDPQMGEKIAKTLISRRSRILSRFGIQDEFNPNAEKLVDVAGEVPDYDRLGKYVDIYSAKEPDSEKVATVRELAEGAQLTKKEVDDLINTLTERMASLGSPDETPKTKTTEEVQDAISEQPVSTNLVEVPAVSEGQSEDLINVSVANLQVGDLVKLDDSVDGAKSKVVLSIKKDEGLRQSTRLGRTLILKSDSGVLSIQDFPESKTFSEITRPTSPSADTNFVSPQALNSRARQVSRLNSRSNAVINDVKDVYPNAVQLSNGDLVVSSRNFTTAGGKSYRYELVVHRKPNEEFVTYVREIELDSNGEQLGDVRINKMSTQTHSSRHLLNRIAPLIRGGSVGQGIYGRHPRNWFNQGRIETEVTNPSTGLPIPRSLAPRNIDAQFVGNTGIESTGDPIKDALITHIASLVERGLDNIEILRRVRTADVLSPNKILDFIERIEANRAFPGVNQIPYVSRGGQDIVRVGDRVRHFSPDGTVKEGVVRLRRPLSVSQKAQGEYGYTDVVVVKFDGRPQGTPIVSSNLQILSRRNGELPEGATAREQAPRKEFVEPENLPEGWSAVVEQDRVDYSDGKIRYSVIRNPSETDPNQVVMEKRNFGEGDEVRPAYKVSLADPSMGQTFTEALISRDSRKASTPEPIEEVVSQPEAPANVEPELPPIKEEEPEQPPKDEVEAKALDLAKLVRDRARELEPAITDLVNSIAVSVGGKLRGLGARLKTTKSLLRKIMLDAKVLYQGDLEEAARNLSDIVRYTAIFETADYTKSLMEIIKKLESEGYKLRIKNYWTDDPKNTYRGVNIKMTKDGVTSELQVHTPSSVEEKENRLTELYQEIRELDINNPADQAKIENLAAQMSQIAASIPKPANYVELQRIGQLTSQSF